jgi:hypothetical protein
LVPDVSFSKSTQRGCGCISCSWAATRAKYLVLPQMGSPRWCSYAMGDVHGAGLGSMGAVASINHLLNVSGDWWPHLRSRSDSLSLAARDGQQEDGALGKLDMLFMCRFANSARGSMEVTQAEAREWVILGAIDRPHKGRCGAMLLATLPLSFAASPGMPVCASFLRASGVFFVTERSIMKSDFARGSLVHAEHVGGRSRAPAIRSKRLRAMLFSNCRS